MTVGQLKKQLEGLPDEKRVVIGDINNVDDIHDIVCAVDSVALRDNQDYEEVVILTN
jgi:hypothetical protein